MNECSKTAIGNRIKQLREDRSMSQEALSKEMYLSREVIAKWETGGRDLKTEYTVKLADFFGVTCDFILRGIKSENVDIHKKLGLSNDAIQALERINNRRLMPEIGEIENDLLKAINRLLESERKYQILSHICLFMGQTNISYHNSIVKRVPAGINYSAIDDLINFQLFENAILETIKDDLKKIKTTEGPLEYCDVVYIGFNEAEDFDEYTLFKSMMAGADDREHKGGYSIIDMLKDGAVDGEHQED